ncbi:MAG: carboxyl transferase domain-containing protein [Dermatophilaceae bacterium]
MVTVERLAIIDRGEPVVRILAAVAALNRRRDTPVATIVVHDDVRERAWYAREADELVAFPGMPGSLAGAEPDPAGMVATLQDVGADTVWLGHTPCLDRAALVEALEQAGLAVVGPGSATIRALADPQTLAGLAAEIGLATAPPDLPREQWRRIEVDVLADSAGTVWAFGQRDTSIHRGDVLVLAESPPPGVSEATAGAMNHAALRLARAAAYRGAGVVQLALSSDGERFWLLGFDTLARPEHALAEENTGASFIGMRLRLATDELLESQPPAANGYAVEARLLAQDPGRGWAPAGGLVELLALPVGTGVRVDASLREGDILDGRREPLVAAVTAWGRDRAEAFDRLRGALDHTILVLEVGTSNRCAMLSLVNRRIEQPDPVDAGWYDRILTTGELRPAADPMALVAAAVEAYRSDSTIAKAAFYASAARGRPAHPEAVGTQLQLLYRGVPYRLRVDRTGRRTYRVKGSALVEVAVDRLSEFERRITCNGRKYRVVAVEHGADVRIELDGAGHTVSREDGVVVRTGWPALVSAILVSPDEPVTVGQPVALLESMKLVSTVTAPLDGVVTSVSVSANAQVERGAPLLRIRAGESAATASAPLSPAAPEAEQDDPVDLASLSPVGSAASRADCDGVYSRLSDYLLGFDLDPDAFRTLMREHAALATAYPPEDPQLLACEDRLLDLFADIGALYRPRVEAEATGEEGGAVNTQEYFLAYLQWLDPDQAGLPERYRTRLEHALQRYGVPTLRRTQALESAMVWMFRSFERVPVIAPAVTAILTRRLAHIDALAPAADTQTLERFERLSRAAEGRQQTVADLARDVIFHYFDEPPMQSALEESQQRTREHLAALAADFDPTSRTERIDALVRAPYPLRRDLLDAWLAAGPADRAARDGVLEVYARRFYRVRELHDLTMTHVRGFLLCGADYEHDGMPVHLVVAYLPLDELAALTTAVARALADVPPEREVVLDIVAWRPGQLLPIEQMADQVAQLVADCRFGRPLHRFDLTITSTGDSDAEGHSTQHFTFRSRPDGSFGEELLYRNLHPMLGKRLDLWRLSNFSLERLASPEDVYLFVGVAHDNPRDKRLFALAEVRDLLMVRDERTGEATYPRLGRIGLEALAAMRTALAAYPPRERPAANRLVLWVRPTWDIPPSDWPAMAAKYETLARGAGLDKLVLHVHVDVPDGAGGTVSANKVITLDGIGRTGLTIRYGDPGPNAIRPLTRYAQKLITAKRFGAPYPYEIVQMLTPAPGDASPFPPGDFQELDLDNDGETLVPVDRPVASNTAHLVVGLLTTYTDVVPEGMTRVAMLSDPTQGLGNLAEPECRRVNASLKYAARHGIPVEWYAVSSGALIAMDSGTENMDFIALTLRRIIEFTQAGGEVNVIVTGINVGGQPYWNAESTMLMHTRGILVMTPASAMVLTGKQALDFSGAVSADDNFGIGGYDRVMGPNGQAQYWAPSFQDACVLLLSHYDYAYVVPGERFPRRRPTSDPADRDIRASVHDAVPGTWFSTVGEVFDHATNPDRKQPFDMRSVMRAVADTDCHPMERWAHWQDADNSIVWDVAVGGIPVCMIGLGSRNVPRKGFVPADGPPAWTSGTLFPQASRKTARAINATSGNRPLVVMANLSGFDGSPESMRKWQLEYGAEIGRAVTNFRGPIVFVVVSRYHGGAFVVFSKALNESMEIAAVEGSYASVIGGAPAAATVFARDVKLRTEKDPRVQQARAAASAAQGPDAGRLRARVAAISSQVRSEKLGEVADEFDSIHTIERALRTGSVDRIIGADQVRPWVIDALERGMARTTGAPQRGSM